MLLRFYSPDYQWLCPEIASHSARLYCRSFMFLESTGKDNLSSFLVLVAVGGFQESSSAGILRREEAGELWLNRSLCGNWSFKRMSQSHRPAWQCWVTNQCQITLLPNLFRHTIHWHTSPSCFTGTSPDLHVLFFFGSLTKMLVQFISWRAKTSLFPCFLVNVISTFQLNVCFHHIWHQT